MNRNKKEARIKFLKTTKKRALKKAPSSCEILFKSFFVLLRSRMLWVFLVRFLILRFSQWLVVLLSTMLLSSCPPFLVDIIHYICIKTPQMQCFMCWRQKENRYNFDKLFKLYHKCTLNRHNIYRSLNSKWTKFWNWNEPANWRRETEINFWWAWKF